MLFGERAQSAVNGFNYLVKVVGLHQEKFINEISVRVISGTKNLIGTLPTGEKIYTMKIEAFIKELFRGSANPWKRKTLPSTMFQVYKLI